MDLPALCACFQLVPTPVKVDLIHRLANAGLQTVEATSFVSPKWVPQVGGQKSLLGVLNTLTMLSLCVCV